MTLADVSEQVKLLTAQVNNLTFKFVSGNFLRFPILKTPYRVTKLEERINVL